GRADLRRMARHLRLARPPQRGPARRTRSTAAGNNAGVGHHLMRTTGARVSTRRDFLRISAAAGAGAALGSSLVPGVAHAGTGRAPARADEPLDILILGGTGFTGPYQVRYASERGHRV